MFNTDLELLAATMLNDRRCERFVGICDNANSSESVDYLEDGKVIARIKRLDPEKVTFADRL